MIKEESGIKFLFPEKVQVVKFDDTDYYRKEFNVFPGAKGVDFIYADKNVAALIEIKNCKGDEGNNRWRIYPNNQKKMTSHTTVCLDGRDSLDIEVSQKAAMTLAAIAGIRSFGGQKSSLEELEGMEKLFFDAITNPEKKKYVILFLEGEFGSHTRSKKMIMSELQRSINAKMKWLNCKVSVVDSNTYNGKLFQVLMA